MTNSPKSSRVVTAIVLLTTAFCISIALNLIPLLRGDMPGYDTTYDWVWDYAPPRWLWVLPCMIGLALYVVGALHLINVDNGQRYPIRLILWAFVGAALIPILLMTLEGQPLFLLFTRTASTLTGGYQDSITRISDFNLALRTWPQFMADYRGKIPVGGLPLSPPGLVALYQGVEKAFSAVPPVATTFSTLVRPLECQNLDMMNWTDSQMASSWLQIFMPIWCALAVAPLYKLASIIFNRPVALWSVALWPLIPTIDMFMPRFNSFYPLIALIMLIALWRGLDGQYWRWVFVSGFILSVAIFFNLTSAPLGLLAGLTIIGHGWMTHKQGLVPFFVRAAINLILFGVGVASTWVIYTLLSHVSPLDIVQTSMRFHTQIQRPYLPWLLMHPYDMFLFVGLPITILCLWRMVQIRTLRSRAEVFTLVAALTILIMVVSGTARGETGRVWSFFAPLWILLAADLWYRFGKNEQRTLFVAQAVYLFVLAAFLHVNFTTLLVPPDVPAATQAATIPVNAQFVQGRDKLTLVGFSADTTDKGIDLHLHWRSDGPISRPYFLAAVPVPPDSSSRQGVTWNPQNWDYPPTCWALGREFVDTLTIPYGEKRVAGDWWFSISVEDNFTKTPMTILSQNAQQIGIGPVSVSGQ